LVTAATAASPPFFVTAFTFQSDFLYLLPAWAGLAFVLRFLSRRRELDLLLGAVCFALSIWNKVHGLFLAAAVVFYLLLVRKKKAILWRQIAYSFFLPAFSYLVFTWTLPLIHPVRTTMERKTGEFAARLLDPTVWLSDGSSRAAVVLLCLGVYALPVLVFAFTRTDRTIFSRKAKLLAATLAAVLAGVSSAYWLAGRGQLFPFTSSVLREWPPMTTRSILLPWTVLSVAGSFVLLYLLGREFVLARRRGDSRPLLVGLAILSQALPLAPILLFMDRYFLVFIPLVLMLVLHSSPTESHPVTPRWIVPAKVGAAVVLLLAVLTIDGLRVVQYRNGVAAQWRAADELVAAGNAPLTVDGGYSWFGWKNYPECLVGKPDSFRPNELHSSYVVELCPWAPIRYDVFFHEMPPPRVLLRTTTFADPLEGPRPIYVYQRPPNTQ
jgi:hypothetical protein